MGKLQIDPAALKVIQKMNALGRPACRVYGRKHAYLIQPMALFSQVYLMHVGPVTRLDRDASVEEVGEAALSALAAYAEFPNRPPPEDMMAPLLKAAGVKSPRGFTIGTAMLSVERAGKRVAIVPYKSETFGAQIRLGHQVLCSPQARAVGERIKDQMERSEGYNRELREDEREHRDEIEADNRPVPRAGRARAKAGKAPTGKGRK